MRIIFSKQARGFILNLDEKNKDFLKSKIIALANLENPLGSPSVLKVKLFNFFRLRAGNFRIFFDIENDTLSVFEIRRKNEKTYK